MNEKDTLYDALDRLAHVADADGVTDRMPGITRRARANRTRALGAGAVGLVAAMALGWVGVSQLPGVTGAEQPDVADTPTASPEVRAEQSITVRTLPVGADSVRVGYRITGNTAAWTDSISGDVTDYSGPRRVDLLLDGENVQGSDGGAIECRAGSPLVEFTAELGLGADGFLLEDLAPGTHTITINAPYCDVDGQVVDSTESVEVTVGDAPALTVAESGVADVDGDGREDTVELLVPEGTAEGEPAETTWLRVVTADETTEVQVLDETSYAWLGITTDPDDAVGVDLGNNEGQEVLVSTTGGGDSAFLSVYGWVDGGDGFQPSLERIVPLDAPTEIATDEQLATYAETSGYTLGGDGLLSWALLDPRASDEATVWAWSVDGTTLTASEQPATQCVVLGQLTDC